MKKTERITRIWLSVSLMMFLLLLCVTGCKKETNDFPEDLAAQLPQTTNYNVHKFVLYDNCPTVRWNINGSEVFMIVDTGAHSNYISKRKTAKKLLGGMFKKIEFSENYGDYEIDFKFRFPQDDFDYILNPRYISWYDMQGQDGLLGLDWMENYNNIVIDYKNCRIDYNQRPISDTDIPMTKNIYKWQYSIPFMLNGREVYGMIDTGNPFTHLSLDVFGLERDENGLYIVDDMCIGDIHYKNFRPDDPSEVGGSNAFNITNVLGYPCFKDHVIQLDFKNNVSRIK